jgi:putative lipase involved disintegration of autophagic bodies
LWDVEGYVGYLPSDSSIFVVFRGTDSLQNLVMDADATSSDYDVAPECGDCKVHSGFYTALNAVWDSLYKEVNRLQALHPDFQVKVTGHSMGAALAQLTGLRLSSAGIETYMINFG